MSLILKCWRIFGTALCFALFGLGALLLALPVSLLIYPLPISLNRKCALTRDIIRFATWLYIRTMMIMGLLTFSVKNGERLRQPGILIIANHPSLLDAVFLFSIVPNATCIIKGAMAKNPFTFALVKLAKYIPNYVHGEILVQEATQAIKNGEPLIIFPEGTRTRGSELNPLMRGAANIALNANCPILPVLIRCDPATLRKGDPWYRIPSRRPHFDFVVKEFVTPGQEVEASRSSAMKARALTEVMRQNLTMALN